MDNRLMLFIWDKIYSVFGGCLKCGIVAESAHDAHELMKDRYDIEHDERLKSKYAVILNHIESTHADVTYWLTADDRYDKFGTWVNGQLNDPRDVLYDSTYMRILHVQDPPQYDNCVEPSLRMFKWDTILSMADAAKYQCIAVATSESEALELLKKKADSECIIALKLQYYALLSYIKNIRPTVSSPDATICGPLSFKVEFMPKNAADRVLKNPLFVQECPASFNAPSVVGGRKPVKYKDRLFSVDYAVTQVDSLQVTHSITVYYGMDELPAYENSTILTTQYYPNLPSVLSGIFDEIISNLWDKARFNEWDGILHTVE